MKRFVTVVFLCLCLLLFGCAQQQPVLEFSTDPSVTKSSVASSAQPSVSAAPPREDPVTTAVPQCWPGVDPYRTVYVSRRSHTVHDSSICSGMKHYTAMAAHEAYEKGYKRCNVCW